MGIQSLQRFIESQCPGASVPVDLLKIARSVAVRRVGGGHRGGGHHDNHHHYGGGGGAPRPFLQPYNRLCLVVDGECCLDRLYGGYFSDWVCGGQWNRMVQFLSVLIQTIQNNNIELAVFFNGGLEPQRNGEWVRNQIAEKRKVAQVLKHLGVKATPPPKVWWLSPVCLRTCLRMALRHLNVTVVCTMDDHHQEVIAFCRENNFHGLMAEDAEYAVFDPPRYFSSEQLKLTYKGSLETKEFILDEVAKTLNLHPNRFCIFAALLGNYLLTEEDLAAFHKSLVPDAKGTTDALMSAVVTFVRGLHSVENLDTIGAQVFGPTSHEKIQKFKQCVQYYLNGTSDGFLRYRPTIQGCRQEPGCYPNYKAPDTVADQNAPRHANADQNTNSNNWNNNRNSDLQNGDNTFTSSRFASETAETELSSLTAYQEAIGGSAPQIVIEPPSHGDKKHTTDKYNKSEKDGSNTENAKNHSTSDNDHIKNSQNQQQQGGQTGGKQQANGSHLLSSTSSSSCSSSPNRLSPEVAWPASAGKNQGKGGKGGPGCCEIVDFLPKVPPEVLRTASERHQKGLMAPWVYQLLSQGEVKIPVAIEEEYPQELPSPAVLFRPMRQMVYAILFNLHHLHFMAKQKKERGDASSDQVPEILVKEWVWSKGNPLRAPDLVPAVPLDWGVPTVQRLWFGPTVDDKKRRIRAFLSCLRSDSPLVLNTSYVPQHLLVMCCVLRYIMSEPEVPILRKQELDAFLAQAVSPHLMNAQYTQNMQLPLVTPRGVQLASLFMQGVECALFANDACGAPIPWLMCCPWLFFDGKLFHYKLLKASGAKSLVDVCDGQLDQVAKVERMRTAILEGLQVQFAHFPLVPPPPPHGPERFRGGGSAMMPPHMGPHHHHHHHHHPHPHPHPHPHSHPHPHPHPHMHHPISPTRGPPHRPNNNNSGPPHGNHTVPRAGPMIARGGQLEIAGVVVGSWGANYGQIPRPTRPMPHHPHMQPPPQVTSVGGMRRFPGGPIPGLGRGFMPRRPTLPTRIRPTPIFAPVGCNKRKPKGKPSKSLKDDDDTLGKSGVGRGCTVQTTANHSVEVSQLLSNGYSADKPSATVIKESSPKVSQLI